MTHLPSRGIARALRNESTVSDLLQHLSDLDFSPWKSLVDVGSGSALREKALSGGAGRADLVVVDDSGAPRALVEVKVAHSFDDRQREKYEKWAADEGETTGRTPRLLLLTVEPGNYRHEGWDSTSLAEAFAAWATSTHPDARSLARQVVEVLTRWEQVMHGAMQPFGTAEAVTISALDDNYSKRVLTRTLTTNLVERGRDAHATVASGPSGTAIVQAWHQVADQRDGTFFIAEARLDAVPRIRFGVEDTHRDPEGRRLVYTIATSLDRTIRVDTLREHLRGSEYARFAELLTSSARDGSGRPPMKGDWSATIQSGEVPQGTSPGFFRDGTFRLEAAARLDDTRATMGDVEVMLDVILSYLADAFELTEKP